MSELSSPPSGWWWHPEIDPATLGQFVDDNHGRIISLKSYMINGQRKFAAVWIRNEGTAWWWNPNVDPPTLGGMLEDNKGRLISLDSYEENGQVRCAAAWVENKGIAWWWHPDIDPNSLGKMLENNKGRLISLKTFSKGNVRRFAAVWVQNDGTAWWWNPNVTEQQLGDMLGDNKGRIVSLDTYKEGGVRKFAAVWIKNDGKSWWWYHGLDSDSLGKQFDLYCAYPMDVVAYESGGQRKTACALYRYPLADVPNAIPDLQITGAGTVATIRSNGDQDSTLQITVQNTGSQPLTIEEMTISILSTGGYVEYPYFPFNTGSFWAMQSKTIPAGANYMATSNFGSPSNASHFVVQTVAKDSQGEMQYMHTKIPILASGALAPEDLDLAPPLFLGLWTKPGEIVPVWIGEKRTYWIVVAGNLINSTGQNARIADMGIKVTWGAETIIEQQLPNDFYNWGTLPGGNDGWVKLEVAEDGTLLDSGQWAHFIHGFEIDLPNDGIKGSTHVWVNYKIEDLCQTASFNGDVVLLNPVQLESPVLGEWWWGSTGNHSGYNAHTWPGQRFSIDLVQLDSNGKSYSGDDKNPTNDKFYAWDQPVYCMKSGTVTEADDSNMDNNGWTALKPLPPPNYVTVQHNNGDVSGYYHFRQGGVEVAKNDVVKTGDLLGYVGNSGGSSEPHLHFGYTKMTPTGRANLYPMQFSNLRTVANLTPVSATPGVDAYSSFKVAGFCIVVLWFKTLLVKLFGGRRQSDIRAKRMGSRSGNRYGHHMHGRLDYFQRTIDDFKQAQREKGAN